MSFKRALPGILLCACLVAALIPARPLKADGAFGWTALSTAAFAPETILGLAVSPAYARDRTLFVLTFGAVTNLWRTQDGALSWQKVLAGSGSIQLDSVRLSPDYGGAARVVYVLGSDGGSPRLWRSPDAGGTWSVVPAPQDACVPFIVASDSALFVAGYDALASRAFVCYSFTGGAAFTAGVSAGGVPLYSMALSSAYAGDRTLLVGNMDGGAWWSANAGMSFLPLASSGLTGNVSVAFDSAFASSRFVYAAGSGDDDGIYRTALGAGQPWQRMDVSSPAGGMLGRLVASPGGVLYAQSFRRVVTASSQGGLLRCLNPASASPSFERVLSGLNDGDELLEGVLESAGNQLWAVDGARNRLLTFIDTLSQPVRLSLPADNAADVGNILSGAVSGVSLGWQPLEGATLYQWQLSTQSDFSVLPGGFAGSGSGTVVTAPSLALAGRYYWRVRATSPLYSPWSDTRSFVAASLGVPQLISPLAGLTAIKPLFYWNPVSKAGSYELVVSRKSDFSNPVVSKTGAHSLPSNYWQPDITLEYATVYYWRVRALASGVTGEWSPTGAFVTQAAPTTTTTTAGTTAAPSNTRPVATTATTSAPPVSTILSTSPVPAATISSTMPAASYPPPVPTFTATASKTAAQSQAADAPKSTTGSPLIIMAITEETPGWVYYTLAGGAAGAVLLLTIVMLARSGKKRLL